MKAITAVALIAAVCAAMKGQTGDVPGAEERLNSVLWAQTAVEHDAAYEQAYRLARDMLDRALKDKTWTAAIEQRAGYKRLPPAVVLDIDETILDNSPEEAYRARRGDRPGLWGEWVLLERATALPGALSFTRYAVAHRVEVIYVTNRDAASKDATRRTLARLGFPLHDGAEALYCQGEKPEWGSDKGSRRDAIARQYRILLLIGDDLGDFLSGVQVSPEERRSIAASYSSRWGERWILLPNPMYGSWEAALYGNNSSLSRTEKSRLKRDQLRAMDPATGQNENRRTPPAVIRNFEPQ